MIPFSKPSITDIEQTYVIQALASKLSGDGNFTKLACDLYYEKTGVKEMLLTTSGTHALELSAILADFQPGDEIIVPSYTFVSTVNAFMLRGVRPVFCEVDPTTMNMDVAQLEDLITAKTKAIIVVHYAGVCCDMDGINDIAERRELIVIEDAAQAVGSTYKGEPAGTLSNYGCYSFHDTKNYIMGEGGGLVINSNEEKHRLAEIIREKGTNRSSFLRGEVDKYTWQSIGSSYLPSEVQAAILCGQLDRFEEIFNKRMEIWNSYYDGLELLESQGKILRQSIPGYTSHNAHMFYFFVENLSVRSQVLSSLREKGIQATFHFVPLHSSPMGAKLGYKADDLPITEEYSERIIRLPLWPDMKQSDIGYIIDSLISCY